MFVTIRRTFSTSKTVLHLLNPFGSLSAQQAAQNAQSILSKRHLAHLELTAQLRRIPSKEPVPTAMPATEIA